MHTTLLRVSKAIYPIKTLPQGDPPTKPETMTTTTTATTTTYSRNVCVLALFLCITIIHGIIAIAVATVSLSSTRIIRANACVRKFGNMLCVYLCLCCYVCTYTLRMHVCVCLFMRWMCRDERGDGGGGAAVLIPHFD